MSVIKCRSINPRFNVQFQILFGSILIIVEIWQIVLDRRVAVSIYVDVMISAKGKSYNLLLNVSQTVVITTNYCYIFW